MAGDQHSRLSGTLVAEGSLGAARSDQGLAWTEVCYRLREDTPPFLESTVTFQIASNDRGGTSLRIIHDLPAIKSGRMTKAAANHNGSPIKLAA